MQTQEEISTALPTAEELLLDIPQRHAQFEFVMESRRQIEAILNGVDDRMLLIVGPCSVHDPKSLLEYAEYFKELSSQVSDRYYMVLRTYFEKPRTTIGWKGYLLDPHLDGSFDVAKGVRDVRQLLSDLTDMGVPVASEILEMVTFPYYGDYLSWGCIGARTSSSPPHRQLASALPFPVGFKNSVDGNLQSAIQGVISANSSHLFLGVGINGQMVRMHGEGNPSAHVVLRGGVNRPNYFPKDIEEVRGSCYESEVCHKIVVDCSHDNCFKDARQQVAVFNSVMEQRESNRDIAGVMLESHLYGGNQPLGSDLRYGVSITDPCLDWPTTKELVLRR
ncbi:MAG: Phospho-2-dehydro-3-deoxyheptonate aldolase, Tyr-sensitive [Chlamydiales bacterium]|nr:Phospho-2-dehydro-3-deoxyheptonate aldolase, Tyr-sensitive [Chlamydiales bacterium]